MRLVTSGLSWCSADAGIECSTGVSKSIARGTRGKGSSKLARRRRRTPQGKRRKRKEGSAHRTTLAERCRLVRPKNAYCRRLNPEQLKHTHARGVGHEVSREGQPGAARAAAPAARPAARAGAREGGRHERTRHPAAEDGRRATRAACSAGSQFARSTRAFIFSQGVSRTRRTNCGR